MTSHLERRLLDVADRLKRQRAELAVTEEQLAFLEEEAEDARLRALVAETPIMEKAAHEASRQADALARQRDALLRSIRHLETEQDGLLDRMSAALTGEA